MSKATLEFNLHEENERFQNAVRADDYHAILKEMDDFLMQRKREDTATGGAREHRIIKEHFLHLLQKWEVCL